MSPLSAETGQPGARQGVHVRPRSLSKKPELARSCDGLVTPGGAELEVDVARVGLDGVERHDELGADLAQRQLAVQRRSTPSSRSESRITITPASNTR
jgi:hypothetical protein